MSVEAISWALKKVIKPSTTKFVLVAIANCADGKEAIAWPSVAYLVEATGQDRKTVMAGIARLIGMGCLADTGERRGQTKQVIVYRVLMGGQSLPGQAQNRNSTENGTVPNFPSNSTGIPREQYRNSLETVPITVHGTIKNRNRTVKEPSIGASLPDWLPAETWADWVAHRKAVKSVMTEKAAQLCIRKLDRLRAEGNDPVAVIEQSIMSGKWTDLYAVKADRQQSPQRQPTNADRNADWDARMNEVLAESLQPTRQPMKDMGKADAIN